MADCFAFLVFRLNTNFCLLVFINCASLSIMSNLELCVQRLCLITKMFLHKVLEDMRIVAFTKGVLNQSPVDIE